MTSAIEITGISKRYRIANGLPRAPYRMLGETLTRCFNPRHWRTTGTRLKDFWALRDVTLDIKAGEALAVIGRNGSGKSTLLKILSRITQPTRGTARIVGRVGSLLEVGTGFHPELTGRENIFLNGGILGMSRREIRARFDEIVEFSGVEQFLDTPVKRYSSGMYVRLAFAVAAHLDPEILLIDEVLAVGDFAFQKKCLSRMNEVASLGRTVVFVSHNMPAVQALCHRAVLLNEGQVSCSGTTDEVVENYVRALSQGCEAYGDADVDLSRHVNRRANSLSLLQRLTIRDADGMLTNSVPVGSELTFDLDYQNQAGIGGMVFAVFLCTTDGLRVAMLNSHTHSRLVPPDAPEGRIRCRLPSLPFIPGTYRIDIAAGSPYETMDYVEQATTLTVFPSDYFGTGYMPNHKEGLIALTCDWQLDTPVGRALAS